FWCMLMTAGLLLVGLPYSVCVAAQWYYGWPDKPGYKKYIEALNPRIYRLTIVTLDLLKYFKYGILHFQMKSWYKNEENSKYYQKGIVYGRKGKKLDLYYPPKRNKSEATLAPVVVFIYGGAWSSGERSLYCLLARQMTEELNTTVICPDYCTYPEGNVLAMVQDIADCLIWVQENGQKFSFDEDNIIVIGHSSGAHLATPATLFLTDARDELFIDSKKQRETASSIRGVILSGIYNIVEYYEHEQKRGIEYLSSMTRAMNGEENFPYYSPVHIVKKLSKEQLSRVPQFVLLHGDCDIVVLADSSVKFYELLTSLSVKVSLHLLGGVHHNEMVIDLMLPSRPYYRPIFRCIQQEFRKLLGPS
uniref:Si:dkey-193c22.1 n=1 Tax=Poecilia latipinna TaxID=48699 RepID=A0A3B3UR48_9TELE